MERNVVDERPRPIATRFELFARRLMESWISAGHVQVSADDFHMAAEFLRNAGWNVEETAGVMVRLCRKGGETHELTREATLMLAVRQLTTLEAA